MIAKYKPNDEIRMFCSILERIVKLMECVSRMQGLASLHVELHDCDDPDISLDLLGKQYNPNLRITLWAECTEENIEGMLTADADEIKLHIYGDYVRFPAFLSI